MSSCLPSRISLKPRIVSASGPCGRAPGERLADEERLREELLDLAGARHGQLVVVGELVHAEDGDDVLQVLVALQHALDLLRHVVVLLADDVRVEDAAGRGQRVHRREEAARGSARSSTIVESRWAKVAAGAGSV